MKYNLNINDMIFSSRELSNNLSDMTLLQLWAFSNLMCVIFILLCMITINNILFGDYLINKFNLENRHPWLTKLLRYRSAIKGYTLGFNIFLIFFMSIVLILFNLLPFLI